MTDKASFEDIFSPQPKQTSAWDKVMAKMDAQHKEIIAYLDLIDSRQELAINHLKTSLTILQENKND